MKLNTTLLTSAISVVLCLPITAVVADQLFQDDVIVSGSLCVGFDCSNGENFNFDTIRLKENNLRIRFTDTSASGSFPTRDWEITINDSANGGANYFRINNIDNGTYPFTIMDGAGNNSLVVAANSNIGFGTSSPAVKLHVTTGNSPTLRLEQDYSQGFAAQSWDVGGNETNFFVRDVTSGGKLPLRIRAGAPAGSIYIDTDGDVGFETTSPDGLLDIAHPADANNHAVLVSPAGFFGINIDNGFNPTGLLDVQTTSGVSRFTVATDGDVGIGTSTPYGRFEIKDASGANTYFNVDADGKVGLGAIASSSAVTIEDTVSDTTPTLLLENTNTANQNAVLLSLRNNNNSYIEFVNTAASPTVEKWFWGVRSNGDVSIANTAISGRQFNLDKNGNLTVLGTVSGGSSVKLKENIANIEPFGVLDKVAKLDVLKWNYISDDDSVKHVGPLSEDFHALFGLNGAEKERISYNDLAGVSLAAIKALIEKNKELEAKIAELSEKLNH